MNVSTCALLSLLGATVVAAVAADATTPIDYQQRNEPFAPAGSVTPEKQKPASNSGVQDKRVEKATIEKKASPLREQTSPIALKEARPKEVREKDSHRPEVKEQPTSRYDHRPAAISTANDTTKPPTVAKYQDSLAAASATNMARFPAMDRATTAKINRFVFQKNPAEADAVVDKRSVTPAAGGSPLQR